MSLPADTRPHALAITTIPADSGPARQAAVTRRGGRPSHAVARELRQRILAAATELFLTSGYAPTTIEAVARRAGISKRTFYHRFGDKAALFVAVVHHIVEQVRPPPDVPLLEGATTQEVLARLARLILAAATSPPAIAINRLVVAESARFPQVMRAVSEQGGSQEAHALVESVLARSVDASVLPQSAREFAARQFLQMVIAIPQQRAMGLGTPMSAAELDAWASDTVTLFLRGCSNWS